MKIILNLSGAFAVWLFGGQTGITADDGSRTGELNAYWANVSRAVQAGDFAAYQATCHPSGVLVSGVSRTSHPLAQALAKWKPGFTDTKAGKIKASVEFRFSQRYGDETTAHETGIFRYSATDADGKPSRTYVHFEALLVKQGVWKIMMEYQKSIATVEEWARLK